MNSFHSFSLPQWPDVVPDSFPWTSGNSIPSLAQLLPELQLVLYSLQETSADFFLQKKEVFIAKCLESAVSFWSAENQLFWLFVVEAVMALLFRYDFRRSLCFRLLSALAVIAKHIMVFLF